jgi:thiol-disulfide isomerase/thioredoxin
LKELAKSSENPLRFSPTLKARIKTTRKLTRVVPMILLFTSDHCAWCDVLKAMLDEESEELGLLQSIFEVDVDRHHHIAEAYSILVVPTLVSGMHKISGVPTASDLRSFILQINAGIRSGFKKDTHRSVLRDVREIQNFNDQEEHVVRHA